MTAHTAAEAADRYIDGDSGRRRLYGIWSSFRNRCNNPRNKSYRYYGGRGIRVAAEWDDFATFRDWAYATGFEEHDRTLTLDRIDVEGDYSPDNCQWVDIYVQANNKRRNIRLTAFGETKTAAQWFRDPRCKVDYPVLLGRAHRGWTGEAALTLPVQPRAIRQELPVGARIGKLVVLGNSVVRRKERFVPVRCDCGTEKLVPRGKLNGGALQSCGCESVIGQPRRLEDYPVGTRIGRLVVVGPSSRRGRRSVPVRCDCGVEKRVNFYNLMRGDAMSCGCGQVDRRRAVQAVAS